MDQYLNKWVETIDGLKATVEVLKKDRDYWKERALSKTINNIPALSALKYFLLKERYRHRKDIAKITQDLDLLVDIDVPETLDMDAWYEIDRTQTGYDCTQKGYEKKGE